MRAARLIEFRLQHIWQSACKLLIHNKHINIYIYTSLVHLHVTIFIKQVIVIYKSGWSYFSGALRSASKIDEIEKGKRLDCLTKPLLWSASGWCFFFLFAEIVWCIFICIYIYSYNKCVLTNHCSPVLQQQQEGENGGMCVCVGNRVTFLIWHAIWFGSLHLTASPYTSMSCGCTPHHNIVQTYKIDLRGTNLLVRSGFRSGGTGNSMVEQSNARWVRTSSKDGVTWEAQMKRIQPINCG